VASVTTPATGASSENVVQWPAGVAAQRLIASLPMAVNLISANALKARQIRT
jgi:hypothetical protein